MSQVSATPAPCHTRHVTVSKGKFFYAGNNTEMRVYINTAKRMTFCRVVTHRDKLRERNVKGKVKASSHIAQYPVLRTAQSALHFTTSLTDLFTQTPSRLLWEASSHMLQLMRKGCSYTYPPLSIVRYSFIQLSELEQCRVKKLAQGFNTAARIRTWVLVVESPKLYP